MLSEELFLIHLSDIHFFDVSGDYYDLDRNLRSEVEHDLDSLLQAVGRGADAILVTGDIAYSGKAAEYEIARDWLAKIGEIVDCDAGSVWVTPGNHDVDRTVVDQNRSLRLLRNEVLAKPAPEASIVLSEILREAGGVLYQPLTEYNSFAAPYQCEIGGEKPYWEDSSLELGDGTLLRMRGLNSTVLSGTADRKGSLLLGEFQVPELDASGVTITLCHHPVPWLLDGPAVGARLDRSVQIQLFGHIHAHQIEATDRRIRLVAGAVHPDRAEEQWAPAYNCISLGIETSGDSRILKVDVYPRTWSAEEGCFTNVGDGFNVQTHELTLQRPAPARERALRKREKSVPSMRQLSFRYLTMPYLARIRIAQDLGLLEDTDEQLDDNDKFRRVLERVSERELESSLNEMLKLSASSS